MLNLPEHPCTLPRSRKRHQVVIYVEYMMMRYGPKWGEMRDKARLSLEYSISHSERMLRDIQHPDYNEFAAKLLTIAWREGTFTTEHWQLMKSYQWNCDEWRGFIKSVYHEMTGDTSFRIWQETMIAAIPWLTERLNYKPMYLPLDLDTPTRKDNLEPQTAATIQPKVTKLVQEQAKVNDDLLIMGALLLATRIADLLVARQKPFEVTPEEVNPEQIDAEDQERIDRIAGDMLNSVNWESEDE